MVLRSVEVCTETDVEVEAEEVLKENNPEDVIAYYGAEKCLKLILSGKVKPNKREKSFRVDVGEKELTLEEETMASLNAVISAFQAQIDPYETKELLNKPMDAKERKIFEQLDKALSSLKEAALYYRNSVTVEQYCTGTVENNIG